MKIIGVEAIPVRVRRAQSDRSAFGTREFTEAGIVRIDTDEGITGWGEICLVWWRMGSGLCRDVERILAPALLGEDPTAHALLNDRMKVLLPGRYDAPARAGVEMAMLDICGKAADLPVYQLLGGAYRERIPVSYSLHMKDTQSMVADARSRVSDGFRTLKVKIGRDWPHDLDALGAIRSEVGPGIALRVDVNAAWRSPSQALHRINEIVRFDVELVEQPLPERDLVGLAELTQKSPIPIAADESMWNLEDAMTLSHMRAADVLNVYFSEAGGLRNARAIADVARTSGQSVWVGSMPELGLGTVANAHLAVSLPELEFASDVCGFLYHAEDILTVPLTLDDGEFVVPDGPGLGVDIDQSALARLRIEG